MYAETRFKDPDSKAGPNELLLGSLQSINPPSRTLIEMTEGERNRVCSRSHVSWLFGLRGTEYAVTKRGGELTKGVEGSSGSNS